MVLKCQEDSFLIEFTTNLVECVEDEFLVSIAPGTQKSIKGIGVVLEDTILFPEGGGQPCDEGELVLERDGEPAVEVRVCYVFRRGGKVLHLVEERWDIPWRELVPGTPVRQTLFWPRRCYHMLQHSGQHLISALAERMFNLETLSWCLGTDSCYIEVEQITEEQCKELEDEANKKISLNLGVKAHVYNKGDKGLEEAKSRGLPEGHVGEVRVIEIVGLDKNMCCGTHVSRLGDLEMIKILRVGKKVFKKKKTALLYFVVGRAGVFERFDQMQKREFSISAILNKVPEDHVVTVTEMKESLANSEKAVKELQKEVAMLLINAFKEKQQSPALFCMHRPDGDLDLLNFVCRQFKEMNVVLFLSFGEDENGFIVLEGPKELIAELATKVGNLLTCKGHVSGNRFQGKVINLSRRQRAEDLIRDALIASSRTA